MTEEADILAEFDMLDIGITSLAEGIGDFTLLPGGEEDIALHSENQRWDIPHWGQSQYQIVGYNCVIIARRGLGGISV